MLSQTFNESSKKTSPFSVKVDIDKKSVIEQIAQDLKKYTASSNQSKNRLQFISKKTEIHLKTLRRILKKENLPSYTTTYKLYGIFLDEHKQDEILKKAPTIIKDYLSRASHLTDLCVSQDKLDHKKIIEDSTYRMIYLYCMTGGVSTAQIKEQFGSHGVETTKKMVEKKLLKINKIGLFEVSDLPAPIPPEALKNSGLQLLETMFRPERCQFMDQNFISLFCEGLTQDAYKKWIEIDQQAFISKMQIAKNPDHLGPIRAFTFSCIDVMNLKDSV